MKLAIAVSKGRVAPLFDTSRHLLVLQQRGEGAEVWEEVELPASGGLDRAAALLRLNIDTLICGAITRELSGALESRGVIVLAFVSGEVHRVVEAFRVGTLHSGAFCMPGCGRLRHRYRGGNSGDEP